MKFINDYIQKFQQQEVERKIEESLTKAVGTVSMLPYAKQAEAIEKIKKGMKSERIALNRQLKELDRCIDLIEIKG
jgi:hypothetical protein